MEKNNTQTDLRRFFSKHAILAKFLDDYPNMDLCQLVDIIDPVKYALRLGDLRMDEVNTLSGYEQIYKYASSLEIVNYKKGKKKTQIIQEVIEKYDAIFKPSVHVHVEMPAQPSAVDLEKQRIQEPLSIGAPVEPDLYTPVDLSKITDKYRIRMDEKGNPKMTDLIRFFRQCVLHLYMYHFRNVKWYKDRYYEYDDDTKSWRWIVSIDDIVSLYFEIIENSIFGSSNFNDPFPYMDDNDKVKNHVLKEAVKIMSKSIKLASNDVQCLNYESDKEEVTCEPYENEPLSSPPPMVFESCTPAEQVNAVEEPKDMEIEEKTVDEIVETVNAPEFQVQDIVCSEETRTKLNIIFDKKEEIKFRFAYAHRFLTGQTVDFDNSFWAFGFKLEIDKRITCNEKHVLNGENGILRGNNGMDCEGYIKVARACKDLCDELDLHFSKIRKMKEEEKKKLDIKSNVKISFFNSRP